MTDTVSFRLAKLGQLSTARFAEGLAPLGLRPRHCAVLGLLSGPPMAQLELAKRIGVTASVVVDMLDELEAHGAVRRIRDTADRRRQLAELTSRGRTLSSQATQLARQIDAELLLPLNAVQSKGLRDALALITEAQGHDARR